jgi:hypothetical protein
MSHLPAVIKNVNTIVPIMMKKPETTMDLQAGNSLKNFKFETIGSRLRNCLSSINHEIR